MGLFDSISSFLDDPFGKEEARDQAAAQAAAQQNILGSLNRWDAYIQSLGGMSLPYNNQITQQMINRQADITGAAASREADAARRAAAASGLGRGGGLSNTERLIREEMSRRNAAAAADIDTQAALGNSQFRQWLSDQLGNAVSAQTTILANAPVNPYDPTAGGRKINPNLIEGRGEFQQTGPAPLPTSLMNTLGITSRDQLTGAAPLGYDTALAGPTAPVASAPSIAPIAPRTDTYQFGSFTKAPTSNPNIGMSLKGGSPGSQFLASNNKAGTNYGASPPQYMMSPSQGGTFGSSILDRFRRRSMFGR